MLHTHIVVIILLLFLGRALTGCVARQQIGEKPDLAVTHSRQQTCDLQQMGSSYEQQPFSSLPFCHGLDHPASILAPWSGRQEVDGGGW